jgi:IS30 family transposase
MAKQLTLAQRYHIAVLLSEGKMQKDIAEKIGTSRSTLTRELQRNGGRENYDPEQAHQRGYQAQANRPKSDKNVVYGDSMDRTVFHFIRTTH